ncbi:MAG: prepilin-type N-terminal cleavage/methylation domain-containing protein [Verrucomicrobia bacterium]|nr:prepilin-type N-terminal cleavage/methylation domain-containing protein [Verrucomicrobiota bacterium]
METFVSRKGFTLVEIMIVTSIVGLLASLAIPSMRNAGIKTRSTRFAREIKAAGHAFVQYALDHGDYPADKNPEQMPNGMGEYLSRFPWSEETVIGGQWDWDYEVFGVHAGVSVHSPKWSSEQMQEIDAMIDDGNLGSGQFRQRSGGYIYILEE